MNILLFITLWKKDRKSYKRQKKLHPQQCTTVAAVSNSHITSQLIRTSINKIIKLNQ